MVVPTVEVNVWAVLVSAIVVWILGSLWYSPILFGKMWMKLSGFKESDMRKAKKKGMIKEYIIMLVGSFITAYVLAHFVSYTNSTTILDGGVLGAWLWIGFIAPIALGMVLWEGKPVKLYLINTGYYLVSLVIMGAILASW